MKKSDYTKIRHKFAEAKGELLYAAKQRGTFKSVTFVVGTPEYGNLGDSAITIAQCELLSSMGQRIVEVTGQMSNASRCKALSKLFFPWDKFTLQGGGNMGDEWFREEKLRRSFIMRNRHRKILIFPQTIYYNNTSDGNQKKQESVEVYNRRNVTLFAREKISYETMKALYPKASVMLTPDIVLSLPHQSFNVTRTGILMCMRDDSEKTLDCDEQNKLVLFAKKIDSSILFTDTVLNNIEETKENRKELVESKLKEFASAKLVITDRLHGMIFSAITGTPCIALSNYNQKVKGTYEWISYLPYIKFTENPQDVIDCMNEFYSMGSFIYDNSPLSSYFDKIKDAIK